MTTAASSESGRERLQVQDVEALSSDALPLRPRGLTTEVDTTTGRAAGRAGEPVCRERM